jgi:ribosome-associated protein
VLLDVKGACNFADYFVICSGDSTRQLQAIYDEITHLLKREGILLHRHEGTIDSGWLVLDFGDVMVHIFAPLERDYYRLDELWAQAIPILRIQ